MESIRKTESDYEKFRMFNRVNKDVPNLNREVKPNKVKKLMESIKHIGFIGSILVHKETYDKTGLLYILDGQHRYLALKNLGLEVPYEFVSGDIKTIVTEMNKNQTAWSLCDYIKSHAMSGIECYVNLYSLCQVMLPWSAIFIYVSNKGTCISKMIRDGKEFIPNPRAYEIINFLEKLEYPNKQQTSFVKAIVYLFKFGSMKHIEKLKMNVMQVPKQSTPIAYMIAFENIVNKNIKTESDRLYLVNRK